jgi:acyl-CoA reductase-like NAD-dependent aldehyde dehydrogenase
LPSTSDRSICEVKNPYNGSLVGQVPFADAGEVRRALDEGVKAFESWRNSTSFQRSQVLLSVAAQLESRRAEFAQLIRDEAGKPIQYAEAEVLRALGVLRWASGEATRFTGELLRLDITGSGRPGFGLNTRFPRGLILGITPFNFPLNLVLHKIAPAVACGCSILIKPSPATPLTALRLAELFRNTGVPGGLVQTILADDQQTEHLTRAPEVAMVSFTGSARVGKLVRAQAVDKPVTLELGGNAWVAVLDDVDRSALPAIAKKIANAAFGYAGQSCISVQNVAGSTGIFPELRDSLTAATLATPFGDTSDPNVISGPVINDVASKRIEKELSQAPKSAELTRSSSGQASGKVIAPTLVGFAEFPAQSSLVQEEIFGPVMTSSKVSSVDELIARINSSHYGLQAGIFTSHWPTIEKLYRELRVGQ